MTGKLKTKGNMMLATKLDGVLKVTLVLTVIIFHLVLTLHAGLESQAIIAYNPLIYAILYHLIVGCFASNVCIYRELNWGAVI